jgi:hypothetical protein
MQKKGIKKALEKTPYIKRQRSPKSRKMQSNIYAFDIPRKKLRKPAIHTLDSQDSEPVEEKNDI